MTEQPATSPSGLYAYTECDAVNVRSGVSLILDWWSDAQMLAAPSVAESLQMCRRFRTLEGHAEVLTSTVPELAGQTADVLNVLGMVRDAGLMISAESACQKLNAQTPDAVDLPPTRVFVITCDRPLAVERLLESLLRAGNLSQHQAFFLVDDSRDPANAQRNRDLVDQFNLTAARDMVYFGAPEARRLMQQLIDRHPAHEAGIRFLIDRDKWAGSASYGLSRNLCLLLSVGHRAIMMDDDVLCQAYHAPHPEPGIDFGTTEREADFYPDHQSMLSRLSATGFDPLSGHASCLGLGLGQALRKLANGPLTPGDLLEANSSYLNLWSANTPVLVTQCGTLGDPGSPNTDWIYYAEGETARRLTDFPGGIQGALSSRSYWLGYTQPSIGKVGTMSQVTGLDNSALLPPYVPIMRGEDATFGAMTEYLHPHSAVLNYDWAVPHIPVEHRAGDPNPPVKTGKGYFSLPKFITDQTEYRAGISAAARLQTLAATATRLSETDDRGLLSVYRREAAELLGLEQARLESVLASGRIRSPAWQGWLEDSRNAINQAMQSVARVSDLPNLPQGMSEQALLDTVRDHARAFATALDGWEAIRETARSLGSDPGALVG